MDEIRMYFEIIKEIDPESILDSTMYLGQLGAITRGYQELMIPDNTYMMAIDFENRRSIAACARVYDKIYTKKEMHLIQNNSYELGTIFGAEKYLSSINIEMFIQCISKACKYILVDSYAENIVENVKFDKKKELNYGDSNCYLYY